VVEADGVFNLCKLKTHLYMGMTGGVKNNFGVIPGLAKPGYHAKLRDPGRFANMLLDLAAYVSPRISIMDGVVGMEGDGPANGDPRRIGLLLAARNPLALDVVAGEIMGLERRNNPVLLAAEKRGLHPSRIEQIDVVGADATNWRVPDFEIPATTAGGVGFASLPWWQRRLLTPLFKGGMTLRPRVMEERCIACGACRDACPMEAISMVDGRHARINDDECIRCYCCHEMCPQDAIELRSSLLYRILNR
jgi:ferredoxin